MTIDPDLVRLLKRLKLGPLLPTLPERLTSAVLYPQLQDLDFRRDVPRLEVPIYVVAGQLSMAMAMWLCRAFRAGR
jgi:hypothetical protein